MQDLNKMLQNINGEFQNFEVQISAGDKTSIKTDVTLKNEKNIHGKHYECYNGIKKGVEKLPFEKLRLPINIYIKAPDNWTYSIEGINKFQKIYSDRKYHTFYIHVYDEKQIERGNAIIKINPAGDIIDQVISFVSSDLESIISFKNRYPDNIGIFEITNKVLNTSLYGFYINKEFATIKNKFLEKEILPNYLKDSGQIRTLK